MRRWTLLVTLPVCYFHFRLFLSWIGSRVAGSDAFVWVFLKGHPLIHSGKWEGHDFFRQKILKYPGPPPSPNKNVPSLIVRRIGISGSYRMFFPSRFRPFLPLGSRSLLCACHVGYAWQAQKEDEKNNSRVKSAKRVLFRNTFFRSRPFDFWEG